MFAKRPTQSSSAGCGGAGQWRERIKGKVFRETTAPWATRHLKQALLIGLMFALGGCGGVVRAPIVNKDQYRPAKPTVSGPGTVSQALPRASPRPAQYVVGPGDTLYAIAWRYGNDYREFARWNNIPPPYVIHPGQRLRLRPPKTVATPPVQRAPESPPTARERSSDAAVAQVDGSRPGSAIAWRWPTAGKIIAADTPLAKNGINIAGKWGQPIDAAAAGEVVYSGSGLIGYGKLIIIKHNDVFLSAYAHNSRLLVKEGEAVKPGQEIAEMGRNGSQEAVLHFEIRRNGKPVDPLDYLPRQR